MKDLFSFAFSIALFSISYNIFSLKSFRKFSFSLSLFLFTRKSPGVTNGIISLIEQNTENLDILVGWKILLEVQHKGFPTGNPIDSKSGRS